MQYSQPDLSLAAFGMIEICRCHEGYLVFEEEGHLRFKCVEFDVRPGDV